MIVVFSIILVSGCGTMPDATTEEAAVTEGTVGGVAIGAIAGGLIGSMIGDDAKSAAIGAGIGAIIGGAIGRSYAQSIASRRQALRGREDDLDAQLAFAQGVNEDTKKYNQQLERRVAQIESEVSSLNRQVRSNQITRQELYRQRGLLDEEVKEANRQLALAEEQRSEMVAFQRQQSSDELDAEIAEYERHLRELKGSVNALASQRQRI
jgi:chromosome segregation ATPase